MHRLAHLFECCRRDLWQAGRSLSRSPGFVLVSVASLSLGIAAATTLFCVVNAVLLRPARHVADSDSLVRLFRTSQPDAQYGPLSFPDMVDAVAQAPALAAAAALQRTDLAVAVGSEQERRLVGEQVSADYFALLGVPLVMGRGFSSEDLEAGRHVAILSHGMWQRELDSDPQVLGRSLRIDGAPHTIIGVAPSGFLSLDGVSSPQLWVPLQESWRESRGWCGLQVVARLAAGSTLAEARAQLDAAATRLASDYPRYWHDLRGRPYGLAVLSASDARVPPDLRAQAIAGVAGVLLVIGLVLLVACSNVATMQLTRLIRRREEIAVRLALGAGHRRLIAQLLAESLVLAMLAGAAGVLLVAHLTELTAKNQLPIPVPTVVDLRVDGTVVAFSLVLTLLIAVLFGLAPALQASRTTRTSLVPALRGLDPLRASHRFGLRRLLVIAQVAGSLVLVAAAALLIRSFQEARRVELGFDPQGVAVLSLDLSHRFSDKEEQRLFLHQLGERLEAVPQVESVASAWTVPLGGVRISFPGIKPEGYQTAPDEDLVIPVNGVSPGYFELLRTPVLLGRGFSPADTAGGPRVMIVNKAFADRFWPGESPLGKQITIDEPAEVVGVVANGRYHEITEPTAAHLWFPIEQHLSTRVQVLVRAAGDPRPLLGILRGEVAAVDPLQPVLDLRLMEEITSQAAGQQRILSLALAMAGALTLALAMIGISGVMAFAVSQRRRELGLRMALGAYPHEVIAMILREGLGLTGIGIATGLVLVLLLSPALAAVVFGISTFDPLSLTGSLLLLVLAAVLASLPAAMHAARVDPMESLRSE